MTDMTGLIGPEQWVQGGNRSQRPQAGLKSTWLQGAKRQEGEQLKAA